MFPNHLTLLAVFAASLVPMLAQAKFHVEPVEWTLDDASYRGMLVYDDATKGKRPGLVMVPNWMGVNDAAVERAKELAGTDFVVLVADVYGKGIRPADAKAAGEQSRRMLADRIVLRARTVKALDVLRENAANAPLDATKLGAVGFCFGGTTVLELARSGANIAGVVSLHGGLKTDLPATETPKASILVLNGAADTYITAEDIAGFQAEMDKVQADWQFVNYAGAVHCFAEASAASPPGCVYHPVAAKRAFAALRGFFGEVFGTA